MKFKVLSLHNLNGMKKSDQMICSKNRTRIYGLRTEF
jgi:hypothetical protein